MSSVSNLYSRARDVASGTIDLEVSWGTIMYLLVLAVVQLFISRMGMELFTRCEYVKKDEFQQKFNDYLKTIMGIGFAIPCTLMITKFVNNEARAFTLLYSIMAIIGSAAILNWTKKCGDVRPSEERTVKASIGVFVSLIIIAIIFMR